MRIAAFFQNNLLVWDDDGKIEPFFTAEGEKRFGFYPTKREVAIELAKQHGFKFTSLAAFVHHIVEATGLSKLGTNPPVEEWRRMLVRLSSGGGKQ